MKTILAVHTKKSPSLMVDILDYFALSFSKGNAHE